MADWSELPKDLLHLISSRLLHTPLYLLRFRSVCSSWLSASPPPSSSLFHRQHHHHHHHSPSFSLSTRTLLLITPPSSHQRPWLLKLSHHPTRLFHPLSRSPLKRPRFTLDLLSLPILHLAHEFALSHSSPNSLFMEKVVLLPSSKDHFTLLTIHVSGKLAVFRTGDSNWTIIPHMPTPYDDVCAFKGALYAVDYTGRTVSVRSDSCLDLVAEPVFGGDKKFLVECEGELLLVDKYLHSDYYCSSGLAFDVGEGDEDGDFGERTVRFEVFRFDEREKRWVEVRSLGERLLFLGDDCAFSTSARDLRVGRGNCVVFRDDAFGVDGGLGSGMGVFWLDDGRILPLSDCPGFSELLWPPPDWIRLH